MKGKGKWVNSPLLIENWIKYRNERTRSGRPIIFRMGEKNFNRFIIDESIIMYYWRNFCMNTVEHVKVSKGI